MRYPPNRQVPPPNVQHDVDGARPGDAGVGYGYGSRALSSSTDAAASFASGYSRDSAGGLYSAAAQPMRAMQYAQVRDAATLPCLLPVLVFLIRLPRSLQMIPER